MRKALKWIGIVIGALVALAIVLVVGALIYGQVSFKKTYANRPLYPITADTGPEGIDRGKYLIEAVTGCDGGCHSEGGTPFAGMFENVNEGPISAVFAVPNLTPEMETGLGAWSDAEIARAIREGVDKDGVALAIMPAYSYHVMSDADVAAVVAYLRKLEPVHNEIPPLQVNAIGKVMNAMGMFGPSPVSAPITEPQGAPQPGTIAYGEYLVSLGDCRACHGQKLNGSTDGPVGFSPNITPGGEVANWTETDFIATLRTGKTPSGKVLGENMPWKAYGKMTDEDLKDVWNFLQSLPALDLAR